MVRVARWSSSQVRFSPKNIDVFRMGGGVEPKGLRGYGRARMESLHSVVTFRD